MSVTENVKNALQSIAGGNCYGEPVTLVAATKMQTADAINEAISAGITDIGENWVQEFREKYDSVSPCRRHFIGHLQTNKIKYLIGKTDLYQSCDRYELASELSKRSERAGVVSNVLIQINIGCEESKGGFEYGEGFDAYTAVRALPGLKVQGFMAMLPMQGDHDTLLGLVKKMRALYDRARAGDGEIRYLSMGMSGDYRLCLEGGSNMVRLGTTLFGARHYDK